jgi:hypothetical protein
MKMKTAVIRQGSVGNLSHNRREILGEEHINYEIENIVLVRETLQEAYHNAFGKAVEEFNSQQKRKDRRIDDYYKKLFKCDYSPVVQEATKRGKNKHAQKSFYENIIQIGNKYDSGVKTEDAELVTECLQLWFNGCPKLNIPSYKERNPNIYVFESSIHLDEQTPHIQLNYIPLAFNNEKGHGKFGLSVQNSHSRALEEMGFGNDERSIVRWREHEIEKYLVPIMESRGIQWIPPDKENKRGYMEKPEYKRFMGRIEGEVEIEREQLMTELQLNHAEKEAVLNNEIAKIQGKLQVYENMEVAVDEVGEIGKKQLLSQNISVPPDEYKLLQEQAKAYRVNRKRIKSLSKTEARLESAKKLASDSWLEARAEKQRYEQKNSEVEFLYSTQINLNKRYEQANKRIRELAEEKKTQAEKDQEKIRTLSETTDNQKKIIAELKEAQRYAYEALANTVKAVGMLKYDDGDYKIESLSPKQERLIDGVADYAAQWAKREGYADLADEIEKNIGISKGIQAKIDERAPKARSYGLSR